MTPAEGIDDARRFVSTGHLPPAEEVATLVHEAHRRFANDDSGRVSNVYPALERVAPQLFGIAVTGVNGGIFEAGDARAAFTIMSISKPFAFALACAHHGAAEVLRRVGGNATGLPFNSVEAVTRGDGRTNPMVNAGAIATSSLIPGDDVERRWAALRAGLSEFAGKELSLDDEVYRSASATNLRNREIVEALAAHGRVAGDPVAALELYTRQCSLSVTARDLATMGATLADGGLNPVTRRQVVSQTVCRHTLAAMATAGLYETSGEWLHEVGLPGKSGIGGGIVTVSPGKGGLGTFAPLLDEAGNSVKGQHVAAFLSRMLGLDLFAADAV